MSSRKEYNLQKGLQAKQLIDDVAKPQSPRNRTNKEVARIRETCPPGTPDERIALILQQTKGDAQKIQLAVSELWENNVQDEWATVSSKKQPKKKHEDKPAAQHRHNKDANAFHGANASNDAAPSSNGGRGRGNARSGRGNDSRDASRGGRGGRGGRGRSAPAHSRHEKDEAQPVEEEESTPAAQNTDEDEAKPKQSKPETSAPVAPAPVLSGAWAKTPSFVKQNKPASPKKTAPAPQPVPQAKPQSPKKPPAPANWDVSKDTKLEDTTPPASTPTTTSWPPSNESKQQSGGWPRSPKKKEEPEPAKLEPDATIASWGASLESSKAQGSADWDATPAWTRTSPMLTPAFGSPKATSSFSPKPIQSPKSPRQQQQSPFPTSPKETTTEARQNKFSMGRWEAIVEPELSLQFGSFSMDMDTPSANWANTSSTPSNAGWPAASPKKTQEAATHTPVKSPRATTTTTAPPGLSESSPKHSPRKFQNAPPNAPSPAALPKPDEVKQRQQTTPSSRPLTQQPQYNSTPAATANQTKLNTPQAAFSSPLYPNHPASYNQYSVGMSARSQPSTSAPSTQPTTPSSASSHLQGSIGKQHSNHGARNAGPAPATSSTAGTGGMTQNQPLSNPAPSANAPNAQQTSNVNAPPHQQPPHVAPYQHLPPHSYHPQYAPPPPPGMAMPYNPYNYNPQYYPQQGYPHGYYSNPQYPQYSPRQYPPRGNIPYGMDAPGFSNPPNVPLGYQDPSLAHPSEYGQGFGDFVHGQQLHPQVPHHHMQPGAGGKPQGNAPLSGNGRPGDPANNGYNAGGQPSRDHTQSPPVPAGQTNPGGYGQQHYGNWAGQYNQPLGGWGGHHQQPPIQGYPPHQGAYRSYNGANVNADTGNQTAWNS
ncbi:unnamed protein product [Aphanomyces euteiches]